MALDTAAKRRSMLSMGDALVGEQVPASGNLGTAARRGVGDFLYSGIDASGSGGGVVTGTPVNIRVTLGPTVTAVPVLAPTVRAVPTLSPS